MASSTRSSASSEPPRQRGLSAQIKEALDLLIGLGILLLAAVVTAGAAFAQPAAKAPRIGVLSPAVEPPTRSALFANLVNAKALDFALPPPVLLRADRMVE